MILCVMDHTDTQHFLFLVALVSGMFLLTSFCLQVQYTISELF